MSSELIKDELEAVKEGSKKETPEDNFADDEGLLQTTTVYVNKDEEDAQK